MVRLQALLQKRVAVSRPRSDAKPIGKTVAGAGESSVIGDQSKQ